MKLNQKPQFKSFLQAVFIVCFVVMFTFCIITIIKPEMERNIQPSITLTHCQITYQKPNELYLAFYVEEFQGCKQIFIDSISLFRNVSPVEETDVLGLLHRNNTWFKCFRTFGGHLFEFSPIDECGIWAFSFVYTDEKLVPEDIVFVEIMFSFDYPQSDLGIWSINQFNVVFWEDISFKEEEA